MIRAVILDLDGTVYRWHDGVPGASQFVARIREWGVRPMFVTNRTNRVPEEVCKQLSDHGMACGSDDVLTASQATARYLGSGSAYCVGEEGLVRALEDEGVTVTEENPDYVVVGFDRTFTYEKLEKACLFINGGARFVATNPDRALRLPNGFSPGTGAIVAAVAAGSGVDPVYVGKPERLIMDMALERLQLPATDVIAVGDNIDTDIPAGDKAGMRTALILTGISTREDVSSAAVKPTWVVEGFEELTEIVRVEDAG